MNKYIIFYSLYYATVVDVTHRHLDTQYIIIVNTVLIANLYIFLARITDY